MVIISWDPHPTGTSKPWTFAACSRPVTFEEFLYPGREALGSRASLDQGVPVVTAENLRSYFTAGGTLGLKKKPIRVITTIKLIPMRDNHQSEK